jgi:predicted metal-dependent phosphoesterase TrpH
MHVHSRYSGRAKHLSFLRCRDCYSDPVEVYRTAKRRGMDLVTLTDHDSIDGCLDIFDRLGNVPDFLPGEEVSALLPEFNHTIHIAVYGLNETQHREIQRLRKNGAELVEYLRRSNLVFALNHLFHDFSDRSRVGQYVERMADWFNIFEVRNGSQQREHNTFIVKLLERASDGEHPAGKIAGSDSHTLRRIGRTYTASSARNREEFVEDIRQGRTQVFGPHSNHLSLAADIYGVVLRYYPTVLSVRNQEFPALVRLKNAFLSMLAAPFLVIPYIVALRHSRTERERIALFSRLILSNG